MNISRPAQESSEQKSIQRFKHTAKGRVSYRWKVWSEQTERGMKPCFSTEHRFTCRHTDCRWWDECQGLRAEWRR